MEIDYVASVNAGRFDAVAQQASDLSGKMAMRVALIRVPELIRRVKAGSEESLSRNGIKQSRLSDVEQEKGTGKEAAKQAKLSGAESQILAKQTPQSITAHCVSFVKEHGERVVGGGRKGAKREELWSFYNEFLSFGVNYQQVKRKNRPNHEEITVDFESNGMQYQFHAFRNGDGAFGTGRWIISADSWHDSTTQDRRQA